MLLALTMTGITRCRVDIAIVNDARARAQKGIVSIWHGEASHRILIGQRRSGFINIGSARQKNPRWNERIGEKAPEGAQGRKLDYISYFFFVLFDGSNRPGMPP